MSACYLATMQGTFASTLQALADSPEVIKASGISEERTLINDLARALGKELDKEEIETGDRRSASDVLSLLVSKINSDEHRKDFGP